VIGKITIPVFRVRLKPAGQKTERWAGSIKKEALEMMPYKRSRLARTILTKRPSEIFISLLSECLFYKDTYCGGKIIIYTPVYYE
jgi:hypothetical protein